jgi:hypothetical protein
MAVQTGQTSTDAALEWHATDWLFSERACALFDGS